MEVKLEVEVHSRWDKQPPTYRLCVDHELFSERIFAYPCYQCYIKENLFCNLITGIHYLTLENLDSHAKFEMCNFKLNDIVVNKHFLKPKDSGFEWIFTIDSILAGKIRTQNN